MQHVGGVDVLEAAEDLVDEGLEVGVGERLAGADDGREVALHELWGESALVQGLEGGLVGSHLRRGRSR